MNLKLIRQLVNDSSVAHECHNLAEEAELRLSKLPEKDFPEYFQVDGRVYRVHRRPLRAEWLHVVDAHQMLLDEIVTEGY